MKKIVQLWQKRILKNDSREEREEMVKHIINSCLRSTLLVLSCITVFEIFFLVNSFIHPKSFRELINYYRICYGALLLGSLSGIAVIIYVKKDYDSRYKELKIFSMLYSVLIIAWSLSVTYLDVLKSQNVSPILFMTIIMCLPACMYFNPAVYFFLDIIGSGIMYEIILHAPDGADTAAVLNFLVFAVIQIIVGMSFITMRYAYYRTLRQGMLSEQKAHRATEAKAAYLANMSHEFRTPLNSIMGMNDMILRQNPDKKIKQYSEQMKEAGKILLNLINDTLDYSKLEAGKMEILSYDYSLSELLKNVYSMMHVLAEKKGLSLLVEVSEDTPDRLSGDEGRIRQIIINFVNNAVKYTMKGTVTLRAGIRQEEDETFLDVAVIDTGIGIKEENQPYVFDSFSQIKEEANRHIEGTGLGLMISRSFVELMGGTIGLESEYGKGSKFFFSIPQVISGTQRVGSIAGISGGRNEDRKDAAAGNGEVRIADNEVSGSSTVTKDETVYMGNTGSIEEAAANSDELFIPDRRIMVVDDNSMNRSLFGMLVEETKVQVDEAASGEECLALVDKNHYDMIFMDHMMPGMDGVETLHRLREKDIPWLKNVPVIALTANFSGQARKEYISLGFTDYLSKPISVQQLIGMLKLLR